MTLALLCHVWTLRVTPAFHAGKVVIRECPAITVRHNRCHDAGGVAGGALFRLHAGFGRTLWASNGHIPIGAVGTLLAAWMSKAAAGFPGSANADGGALCYRCWPITRMDRRLASALSREPRSGSPKPPRDLCVRNLRWPGGSSYHCCARGTAHGPCVLWNSERRDWPRCMLSDGHCTGAPARRGLLSCLPETVLLSHQRKAAARNSYDKLAAVLANAR